MREDDVTIEGRRGGEAATHLDRAQHLLDSMQQQIRSADEKIRVLFGATALLAAALAFASQQTLTQVQQDGLTVLELTTLGARVLLLLAVAAAVASGIAALLLRGCGRRRGNARWCSLGISWLNHTMPLSLKCGRCRRQRWSGRC